MKRVLIVGQLSYDINIRGKTVLGGPGTYQTPIFLSYGWEIDILTKIDSSYPFLKDEHLKIINMDDENTTTFQYLHPTHQETEDRILVVRELASKFEKNEVVNHLRDQADDDYDLIIFSGIGAELSIEIIRIISELYPDTFKILDLQSLTRKISDNGEIEIIPLTSDEYKDLFTVVDIIRGSSIELGSDFKESGVWKGIYHDVVENNHIPILIESSGSGLITLYGDQITTLELSTIENEEIVDSTGSGDIFLATLGNYLHDGKNISDAILFAHHVTKDHLMISGVPTLEVTKNIIENAFQ